MRVLHIPTAIEFTWFHDSGRYANFSSIENEDWIVLFVLDSTLYAANSAGSLDIRRYGSSNLPLALTYVPRYEFVELPPEPHEILQDKPASFLRRLAVFLGIRR